MTPDQEAWFAAGLRIGHMDGYAAAEADMQAAWSAVAQRVRVLGKPSSLTYAELCDRRREPERAERAREHERRIEAS